MTLPRIAKETREILPMWALACIVVWMGLLYLPDTASEAEVLFPIPVTLHVLFSLMAAAAFGREFSYGTMARLLAQPVSRSRIWAEKTVLLAAAFASVLLLFGAVMFASWGRLCAVHNWTVEDQWRIGEFLALAPLFSAAMVLCNASLAAGFVRQTFTAFWITLLAPIALVVGLVAIDEMFLHPLFGFTIHLSIFHNQLTPLVALWCAAAYPLAWNRFRRMEV